MDNFQSKFNVADLIARYLRNQLSTEEELELERWIDADPQNLELFNKLINNALDDQLLNFYTEHHKEDGLNNIDEKFADKNTNPWWRRLFSFKYQSGQKK